MRGGYTPAMKAAVYTRHGPPEVVVISEVEKPVTGDNGLLVKVCATTVNRTDCAYRAARPFFMRFLTGLIRPRPAVLGTEFAGVVEAVGSGVTSFGAGDKVFGYNEGLSGAHAEYLSVPRGRLGRDHAGQRDLPAGRSQYRRLALRPRAHQGGEDPQRAGHPCVRRNRCYWLSGGPTAEEPGCQRDRGLRHRPRGAGQGLGRRQSHRLH